LIEIGVGHAVIIREMRGWGLSVVCRLSAVFAQSTTSEVLSTEAPTNTEHGLVSSCALCHQVDDKGAEIDLLLGIATAGYRVPFPVILTDAGWANR
jgi:hypothetical protein